MARYIDADELTEKIQKLKVATDDMFGMGIVRGIERVETAIEMQPTLNVAIVKHGEWIDTVTGYTCSTCHTQEPTKRFLYCPNCGARMDGGEAE